MNRKTGFMVIHNATSDGLHIILYILESKPIIKLTKQTYNIMKKSSLLCALVAIIATLSFQSVQAQDYKNLPQNIKNYIGKHFKGYTISHYEKDREILDVEYKVYISNNNSTFKLDFDSNGVVEDVESTDDRTALPNSVLPVKITQHVKNNFPKAKIIEWRKKKNTQVVELTNDMELVFSSKGDFLRIDD